MSSFSGPRRYFANRRGGRFYKHSHRSSFSIASVFNKILRDLVSVMRPSPSSPAGALRPESLRPGSSKHQQNNNKGEQIIKANANDNANANAGKLLDTTDNKPSREKYFEKLKILKILGEGKFATCYLATDDKNLFALKLLKKNKYKKNPQKAKNEEDILKSLKHEAIPRFIRKIDTESSIGFVLEYKQGINLEDMISSQGHVFTRNEIYNIGKQLIDVLKYLHGKGVVHRDIRLPNVLLNDKKIYLVDFGLARRIDNKNINTERDLSCLGEFLLHLYYSSYKDKSKKSRPWYEELKISSKEITFLKKLMGDEKRYRNIREVEKDFEEMFSKLIKIK